MIPIKFYNKIALYLLILIPFLILYYLKVSKRKKKEAIKFSYISFIKKANKKVSKRQKLLFYLSLFIIFLTILALSDPHIKMKHTRKGVNVVLVIDTSGSMQANDYKPTRLEAAKAAAGILIKSLKENDYIGIVTFESGATTACYLTPDKERALERLRAIKSKQGRTAIGDGLSLGIDMATSIPNKKKIVILLSDGSNNAGVISPDEAIQYAKINNVQVYTIGLGSKGKTILGYDWFGNPIYADLDEKTLKKIAYETGGQYFKSVDSKTLDEIYKTISKKIKREKEYVSIKDWIISLVLILLLYEFYLRYGYRRIIQ